MSNDRDDSLDRLLTAIHGRADTAVSPDCLDAETLAAWMDDQLGGPALARAEAHAAACAHCQSMLAAMARTADAGAEAHAGAAAPRSKFWRMLPWAAPLTAAATAAALYLAVRPGDTAPGGIDQVIEVEQTERSVAAQPSPAEALPSVGMARDKAADAEDRRRADLLAPSAEAGKGRAAIPIPRAERNEKQDEKEKLVAAAKASPVKQLADASSPPPLPPVREMQPAPAPPAALPVPPLQTAPPQAAVAPLPAAAAVPKAQQRQAGRGAIPVTAVQESAFRAQAPIDIATPDPAIRWRLTDGTVVQFSNDQGKTWTTQQTGTAVGLSAGAAPSSTVCWIVGRAGTVLRTTDGRTWQRLAFPEPADLVRIVANSAEIATVTAADGRTFTTTDGGKTWGPSVP